MQIRQTKQKSLIREILEKAKSPISAKIIVESCQKKIPSMNKTTVYRELEKLVASGTVTSMLSGNRELVYELSKADADHHHHFHCTKCEKLVCLDVCTMNVDKMLPKGFVATSHDLTIHGLCTKCN